jgi:uncharacterized repeat protein (TIGR01451 family)
MTIFGVIFLTNLLHAQDGFWQELKSPYGGDMNIIPTSTSTIFATSSVSQNVFRSDDYGKNWLQVQMTKADTSYAGIPELVIAPSGRFYQILRYSTGNLISQKLYTSLNDGQTWELQLDTCPVNRIFTLPSGTLLGIKENTINGDYLYRSSDHGITWNLVYNDPSGNIFTVTGNYIHATNGGKAIISSRQLKDLIITENDGLSWTSGKSLFANFNTNFILSSGTILSLRRSSFNPEIFKSTDGGTTWTNLDFNFDSNDNPSGLIELNSGKLLLATDKHLYTSVDEGTNWVKKDDHYTDAHKFPMLYPLDNGDILGVDRYTLVRSSNEGQDWSISSTGLNHSYMLDLIVFDQHNFLCITPYGLWSTPNASDSWELLLVDTSRILPHAYSQIVAINLDSFAVAMGDDIWATTDHGQNFINISPPGGNINGEIYLTSNGSIVCSNPQGVQVSSQFTGNWTLLLPNFQVKQFSEHQPSGKWFIVAIPDSIPFAKPALLTSVDHGLTWMEVSFFNQPGLYFTNLRTDKSHRVYVTDLINSTPRISISENGGLNWKHQIVPHPFANGIFDLNAMGHIFASINLPTEQILSSTDQGSSWYLLPAFKTIQTYKTLIAGGYIYSISSTGDLIRSTKSTESGAYIHATVNRDADLDCSTPDAQEPLKNWNITVSGEEDYYGTTGANGYCTFYLDTAVYSVKTRVPQALWWSLCDSVQTVEATLAMGSDTVPFVALPLAECPLMSVNVAAPMLRRCFNNTVYINYCNQGTEPADSAWVDVMLDEYLSFISSAQPHESLGNNVYRFYLGDVNSGDCGDFNLTVYVSCDSTVLGQTHCIGAHGFPDTLCTPTPSWSGANIEASVVCQDTLVQFKLENTGQTPSSTLEYIIIEDDVVLFTGQKSYAPGESILMDYDANGSTWRIESRQEPGHPFSYLALAFEEGCGGFESLGFINQFPVNGISPSWHRVCVENIGAYDPNDKQGFPNGVGEDHNIRPGQELEYLIRFQNTGTDTAFTVMIRDTLSAFLDPASVRPGASSHPYTWSLSGEGVITFMFKNILLPDSNINEPASHGFVQFRIAQQPNLPLGSVIENDAAIYFDFNAPIITNTTWHTLYKSPLMSATNEPGHNRKQQSLEIWPNPVKDQTSVRLKKASAGNKRVNLYNSTGQTLQSFHFTGQETILKCPSLTPGHYWIQVTDVKGITLGSSVLVKE